MSFGDKSMNRMCKFQVPPQLNMPKSQLQCYGESVYCFNEDMLRKCNSGKNPIDRFVAVVAWNISTLRPLTFGIAPFNPILGETHHASAGSLNILLEQVLTLSLSLSLSVSVLTLLGNL